MASKTELIARLEELTTTDDVELAAEAVESVKEAYEALVAASGVPKEQEATDEEAPDAAGATPVPIESAPPQDEEDKRFKQLLDVFNQKVNDIRRRKAKEEADNLAAKKEVMDKLRALISGEENIGNAFQQFKDLQEQWRGIGNVPQQAYRELQSDYSHLLDEFFYHIRIYKELRDHDLRKNTALKQALISDMTALAARDNVKELESLVRDYQDKWHAIGPVVREEWEAVRDGFWNATRSVYDKIHEHYKARRAEHETNLQAKQHLVERVALIVGQVKEEGAKDWKALTEQVLETQNAWKAIGFATKKDNERIWKEFRDTCNAFFDAKKAHFDQVRDQYRGAREKKQALIAEAVELKDSTEWRRTADKLKALQQQWKEAGRAGPRDENKLWTKFREACDAFFQARKATFEQLDAEQAVNAQQKEALIAEIEAFQLSGEHRKDVDALKAFSQRWLTSGRVSPKQYDAFSTRYHAALDKQYGQLKIEGGERQRIRFQNHMEDLRSGPDGKDRLERESRFIKRKITELEDEKRSMEQNMGMFNFKSASGEAMKKEIEKKIERLSRDVERLKGQHRDLLKELR